MGIQSRVESFVEQVIAVNADNADEAIYMAEVVLKTLKQYDGFPKDFEDFKGEAMDNHRAFVFK